MKFKKYYEKIMASKYKYIVILGIIGIVLIAISTIPSKKKDRVAKQTNSNNLSSNNIQEYISQMEEKVNSIVSQIEGVGKSKVLITIEKGIETVYANSEKKTKNTNENMSGKMSTRDDTQRDVVIIDGPQGKQALVITQKEPTIKGVVVACEGADNPKTVASVIDAVSKCLNIGSHKLAVVKFASQK